MSSQTEGGATRLPVRCPSIRLPNRHAHIRCALAHDVTGARLCRQHNDANVLAMGGRLIGEAVAKECVEVFLSTKFDGGRHQKRVDKLGSCCLLYTSDAADE